MLLINTACRNAKKKILKSFQKVEVKSTCLKLLIGLLLSTFRRFSDHVLWRTALGECFWDILKEKFAPSLDISQNIKKSIIFWGTLEVIQFCIQIWENMYVDGNSHTLQISSKMWRVWHFSRYLGLTFTPRRPKAK